MARALSIALVLVGLSAAALLSCEPSQPPTGDAPTDAPIPVGRCGVCPAERPHCDEAEGICVACDEPEHCTGPLHQCVNGRCVECVMNVDCPTLEASECYIGTHACRPCTGDDACLGRAGTPHCVAGTCAP